MPFSKLTIASLLRPTYCSVLASAIFLCACDQARAVLPRQQESAAIYEFRTDDQGRTLRLNKATGELVIVRGQELIPLAPSSQAGTARVTTPVSPAPTRAATTAGGGRHPAPSIGTGQPQPPTETPQRPPAAIQRTDTPVLAAPQPVADGPLVTILWRSAVVPTTNANQTPMAILEQGVVATLVGREGDWLRVQFESPTRGRLTGYIARSAAAIGATPATSANRAVNKPAVTLTPTDLSIPALKLTPIDLSVPTDLSVPGSSLAPTDLSVPELKR